MAVSLQSVELSHLSSGDGENMAEETNLDDSSVVRGGYERFFNVDDDLNYCESAIITVQRKEQITTHFGPLATKNIKVSLSQEQIVNDINNFRSDIKRSQSINIQKTAILSPQYLRRDRSLNLSYRSKIPIKIKEPLKICAPENTTNDQSNQSKLTRGMSVTNEREILSSLPLPMTQSMDTALDSGQFLDIRSSMPDKYKCGICLYALSDPRVLDCLHTFCLECLYKFEVFENTNNNRGNVQTKSTKVNLIEHSNSRESNEINTNSINHSESTNKLKDHNYKFSKLSISSLSTNPIRKIFSTTQKKRSEERKSSISLQPNRRFSSVTEKNRISLKCPVCGFRTNISIGGVSRLPKNFLLERQMIEELQRLEVQRLTNEHCSLCYDDNQAVSHCVVCQMYLCELCQEAHLRQRTTSKHNVITINELKVKYIATMKDQNAIVPRPILKCFIHPTQDIKLYCLNCNQVACHNCTILLHKDHKFETLAKATKHMLRTIRDSLEKNQKYFEFINESISKLAGSIPKINSKADSVKSDVELFLTDYFEALEAHKETLLRQIAKAKEMKHLSIMEQQEYLQKRAQESKQANLFADSLLKNGNDTEILIFIGTLLHRFDYCQKMSSDPKIPDAFQFLREIRAPATQQQHNIPMYGIIATQVADPKISILEVEEPIILRIHRRSELKMIAKDSDDRPLCHGGIKLIVELRYKDDPNKRLVTEVNDKRDGSYIIAFTPDVAGSMTLSVKIQNVDIKGSPFSIGVRTLTPHSGIFHCCTFCSSKGSKTISCACNGKMPGYKGCGHGHGNGHPGRRHWSCCASVLETSECSATNAF